MIVDHEGWCAYCGLYFDSLAVHWTENPKHYGAPPPHLDYTYHGPPVTITPQDFEPKRLVVEDPIATLILDYIKQKIDDVLEGRAALPLDRMRKMSWD